MVRLSDYDKTVIVDQDTVQVRFDSTTGMLGVRVGTDSLAFDLRELAARISGSADGNGPVPPEQFRLEATGGKRRAKLALESLNGKGRGKSVKVEHWQGRLFLGTR